MMMRNMSGGKKDSESLPLWFKAAAISAVLFFLLGIILIFSHKSTPGGVTDSYVTALAHRRCGKAYDFVSYTAKKSDVRYKDYDSFLNSVCIPVSKKYTFLEMRRVEDTIQDGDHASVLSLLRFKASWMPKTQLRTIEFRLIKEEGKWKMDDYILQP